MDHLSSHSGLVKSVRVIGAAAIIAVVSSACVSTHNVDMEGDRAVNLRDDMRRLAESRMVLPDKPLTLNEAINFALIYNLDLRVAELEQQIAEDDALAARLDMLPNLNLNASKTRRSEDRRQDYIDADTGVVQNSNTLSSFKSSLTADLSLTWNVLDFGMSWVRARQAGYQTRMADLQRLRQAQLLALEITNAYWRAALAEDSLDYIRAVAAEMRQQKAMIERSVAEHRVDPIMAKDAQRRIVELEITIRDLQAEVSSSRIELSRLMGLKQGQDFTLEREAIRPILAGLPRPHQLDIELLESHALHNRPELFAADFQEKINRDNVRAELLSMFPDLTFGIGRHYDDNRLLHANNWNTVGVNFGWNLLKLPSLAKRKNAREHEVEQAKYERLQTTVGVVTQVHLSLLDYAVKVDRMLLLEESYTLANDVLSMVQEHNRLGKISDLAVTERVLQDLAAKMRRDQSVVDVMVSYRRMLSSSGVDLSYWNSDLNELALLKEGGAEALVQHIEPESQIVAHHVGLQETSNLFPWTLQVGAYRNEAALAPRLEQAQTLLSRLLNRTEPVVTRHPNPGGGNIYRARYLGFTEKQARHACSLLKEKGMDCWVDKHDPTLQLGERVAMHSAR